MTLVATDGEVDGNLTVTDTGGADTITTGDGDDSITVTPVSAKADAVTGDAGTDELIFGTATIDVGSGTIQVNLAPATSDQIATENNFFTGNQTGLENFDLSGLTLTNANAVASEFLTLNTTTDLTTTSLKGTGGTTDKITDIATGVDMSPITNTGIEVIDLANGGVSLTIDAANLTDVTTLSGGSAADTLVLAEAAAFNLNAVTTFSNLETINMAASGKVATSIAITETGTNDFAGAITGASGTAQTLTLASSADTDIGIIGITNTLIETITLADDDDDLTVDTANLTNVTAINGVSGGNAEFVITNAAEAYDFKAITLTDITIKKQAANEAQTITSGIGVDTIDLVGSGAGDTVKFDATNALGDTVSNWTGGTDTIAYNDGTGSTAAIADNQIAVIANVTTDLAVNSSQNLGSGNFDITAKGYILVGNNSASSSQALYYFDGSKSSSDSTRTVTEFLADGDVVLICNIGLIGSAIAAGDLDVY
jgi:hypothetical protein